MNNVGQPEWDINNSHCDACSQPVVRWLSQNKIRHCTEAALFSYPSIILKISIDISITFTVTFNNIIAIISFLYFVIDIELKERHCQFVKMDRLRCNVF